jgi:hypothetical protein
MIYIAIEFVYKNHNSVKNRLDLSIQILANKLFK